jgi:hypothetical protein
MNNKIVAIILFFASTFPVFGQTETNLNGTPVGQKRAISLAYYGYQIANPGVLIGVESYLATTQNFQVIAGLDLKYQQKQAEFSAIGINARIGQRYTANFGLMLEMHLGLGIQQTFYTSKVYNLTTQPITESIVKSNKLGVSPNINFGIGYDFSKKTSLPIVYYIRPSVNWLLPDKNLAFQINPSLETGIIYKLGFKK